METTNILITVPTLSEVFGWFVFYVWCGVIAYTIYAVSFVVCDYGRTAKRISIAAGLFDMAVNIAFWPLMYRYIKDNFSYRHFNRPYNYYR